VEGGCFRIFDERPVFGEQSGRSLRLSNFAGVSLTSAEQQGQKTYQRRLMHRRVDG
jgi:hypothetical protein